MRSYTQRILFIFCFILLANNVLWAQMESSETLDKRFFGGSSLFMLGNFLEDSPQYIRLDIGYRFTPKDAIIIQPLSWAYHAPLGIPYSKMGGS